MKKKLFLIPVCLLSALTLALGLAACGETESDKAHTHEYAATWSSDANKHWHACTASGDCNAPKKDEAEHAWNDGEVTTPATAEEEGVKTYTCPVCGKTKTEHYDYYTVTGDEWKALFACTNFTLIDGEMQYTYLFAENAWSMTDGTRTQICVKDGEKYYYYMQQSPDGGWRKQEITENQYKASGSMKEMLGMFADDYASFAYDAEIHAYKCASLDKTAEANAVLYNIVINFADLKLCGMTFDTKADGSASQTVRDVGTTVITIPAVSE